jgi:hypothetical protein
MIIRQRAPGVIDMEVDNAVKPMARYGIFLGRNRICDVEDDVPEEFLEKHLVVRFRSGLVLNCRGDQVASLREGRQ